MLRLTVVFFQQSNFWALGRDLATVHSCAAANERMLLFFLKPGGLFRLLQICDQLIVDICGQVTFKKQLSYFTSVTCKSNSLHLIRYPFFIVTVPLQLPVTDILNVTKQLLVTTKSNQLRSGTVTPLCPVTKITSDYNCDQATVDQKLKTMLMFLKK